MIRALFYLDIVMLIWNVEYFIYSIVTMTHLGWVLLNIMVASILAYQVTTYDYFEPYRKEVKKLYLGIIKGFKK